MNNEHEITFGELTPDGLTNVRVMRQSNLMSCPFTILVPEHYRPDGTCLCDDPEERARMIREWEYTEEDFQDIPLRP